MSFDLAAIRSRFPALSLRDGDAPRIYLDNPGGTQVPDSVVERMAGYLTQSNANLGGVFRTSQESEAVVAEAREAMADFLNAPSASEIMFGQNMTSPHPASVAVRRPPLSSRRPGDPVAHGPRRERVPVGSDGTRLRTRRRMAALRYRDLRVRSRRARETVDGPYPARVPRRREQPARHDQRREARRAHGARGRGLALRGRGAGGAAQHHGRAGHRLRLPGVLRLQVLRPAPGNPVGQARGAGATRALPGPPRAGRAAGTPSRAAH